MSHEPGFEWGESEHFCQRAITVPHHVQHVHGLLAENSISIFSHFTPSCLHVSIHGKQTFKPVLLIFLYISMLSVR